MAAVTRLGQFGYAARPYPGFAPAAANAVVTGTALTGGVLEAEIVAGGETIIITLANDTWVSSGATFNAQRQNIIDGLDSAQSETAGWNAEVRDKEAVTAVVRTSDTVVTITLSAAADYAVDSDETITVTVPGSALAGGNPLIATPTFDITAQAEAAEEVTRGAFGEPSQPYERRLRQDSRQEVRRDIIERIEALRRGKVPQDVAEPVLEATREFLRDGKGRFISASGRKAEQRREIPPVSAMNLEALLRSTEAIERLTAALIDAQKRQLEDEVLVLMMLA